MRVLDVLLVQIAIKSSSMGSRSRLTQAPVIVGRGVGKIGSDRLWFKLTLVNVMLSSIRARSQHAPATGMVRIRRLIWTLGVIVIVHPIVAVWGIRVPEAGRIWSLPPSGLLMVPARILYRVRD